MAGGQSLGLEPSFKAHVVHVVGYCLGWIVDTVYTSMLLIISWQQIFHMSPYDQISTSYYGDGPGTVLISALEPCCGVVLEAEDPRTELLLEISLVVKRQVRLRNGRTSLRGSQENFLGKDL
jgi:hypothetical protein